MFDRARRLSLQTFALLILALSLPLGAAQADDGESQSIDQKIDSILSKPADVAEGIVFWSMPLGGGKAIRWFW